MVRVRGRKINQHEEALDKWISGRLKLYLNHKSRFLELLGYQQAVGGWEECNSRVYREYKVQFVHNLAEAIDH